MRPVPRVWLRLPPNVTDGATLAAQLRAVAADIGDPTRWPSAHLAQVASWLDACRAWDAGCLRSVVDRCDERMRADDAKSGSGEHLYWETLAHAVDRIADHLEQAGA